MEREKMNKTTTEIWNEVIAALKAKLSVPGFKTFLASAKMSSFEDGILTIQVPNEYTKKWIQERCEVLIGEHLNSILGNQTLLQYKINPQEELNQEIDELIKTQTQVIESAKNDFSPTLAGNYLNPKYTFETFVVGQNNRFAQSAALAVAKNPSKAYNPLFIYGGVGLGKTHLLQAIAHTALRNNPALKVVFVSSEKFTNELINAIRDGKNEAFRSYYRNIDLLLVDDIQFLAGKERTQEEFFHTFNTLHQAGKQIVLSSDRSPKEIANLEARLRSRFEWGLIADIQAPEFETRIAILRKKADADGVKIPDEVITYIASQIPSNIRELEGALVSIVAYSSLVNSELNVELAADVIKDVIAPKQSEKPITITLIKKMVAEYFHIDKEDLNAKIRTKEIALARQIAMHLSRELTNSSLPKIGEDFGGRDHTTVMHACDKIKELTSKDSSVNDMVKSIENSILSASE
jgi:chromosomal replication initiator protein